MHLKSNGKIADLNDVLYIAPLAALCLLKLMYFSFKSYKLSRLLEILSSGPCKSQSESELQLETNWEDLIK